MIPKKVFSIIFLSFISLWILVQFLWIRLMPSQDSESSKPSTLSECHHQLMKCTAARTLSPLKSTSTMIYVITPTYARPVQKAELTRMVHTLLHVGNLHWIVVEDSASKTELVSKLLNKSGLRHTHLNFPTPDHMRIDLSRGDKKWSKPRGVWQRNEGLRWLRESVSVSGPWDLTNNEHSQSSNQPTNSVLYFADDDNTYDLALFDEIRSVHKVGVWPVAFVGELLVEKPTVVEGKVTGWNVAYKPERPFAIDMAGFAVHLDLVMRHPTAGFEENQPVGYQETYFLKGMGVVMKDLEAKAGNCTQVLVWHTRTEPVSVIQEKRWRLQGRRSDEGMEF